MIDQTKSILKSRPMKPLLPQIQYKIQIIKEMNIEKTINGLEQLEEKLDFFQQNDNIQTKYMLKYKNQMEEYERQLQEWTKKTYNEECMIGKQLLKEQSKFFEESVQHLLYNIDDYLDMYHNYSVEGQIDETISQFSNLEINDQG